MDISRRLWRVWQRNYTVYRRTWRINFLPPLLEPVFYLLAFGAGLGVMIESVTWMGAKLSYVQFIAPALVGVAVMQNSFFETTYASFVRMYYQKTFDAMLATPLSIGDIIAGEIIWGATKSLIAAVIMTLVLTPFGLVDYPSALLVPLIAVIGGIAFASLGMLFTAVTPSIEVFNIPVFIFVTPMFLFSGTFFPLDSLPRWAALLAQVFPLTHLVLLVRAACLGKSNPSLVWSLLYLIVFTVILFPIAVSRMRRRLVK